MPNIQRQHRALQIHEDVMPYALCQLKGPVSAALASNFRLDSISTSYTSLRSSRITPLLQTPSDRLLPVIRLAHLPAIISKSTLLSGSTSKTYKNLHWRPHNLASLDALGA